MLTLVHPGTAAVSPTFEELRDQARELIDCGQLEKALAISDQALELARREGNDELVDSAVCNRSAVLITLGRQQEVMGGLRQILLRNRSAESCFLSAYSLSRAHVRDKQSKKGLFYARIARDRAEGLDRREWLAMSCNQVANCLTDESHFRAAAAEYRRALALLHDGRSITHAMLLANLGYCQMVMGRVKKGLSLSFQALRWFRYQGGRLYEVVPQLDLCYAYLELGRYDRARNHGLRGLALAEESGESDRVKVALYLLGDTERAAGNSALAYEYFSHLQQRFYPESPQLAELMIGLEMRQMVNLRA